jgi:hypothetical protein
MGRWLPEVESYGLYCCASNKANDQNPYLYHGPRGEGCMQAWQTREYFERARHHFLLHAGYWQGGSATDLKEVRKSLHRAMMHRRRQIVSGLESLGDFQVVEQEVIAAYGDIDALQAEIEARQEQQGAAKSQHERLRSYLDELYALWERRSLWVRLLSLVPGIGLSLRQQEHRKTARLLNQWDLTLDDHTDAAMVCGWISRYSTKSIC